MNSNRLVILYAIFFTHLVLATVPYQAVVIVPVADTVGAPMQQSAYDNLPLCGGTPAACSCCPRLHQLLCNEMGMVIKEHDQEVLIKIFNCFYVPKDSLVPQCSYWTLKKNIISLHELEEQGVAISHFPPPIAYDDPASIVNARVVTLALPWHDTATQQTFSAGTRFIKVSKQDDHNQNIPVYTFDPATTNFTIITIPLSFLIIDHPTSMSERIKLFVQLLKQWAHPDTGFIPYVLGGCSFTVTTHEPFIEKFDTFQDQPCSYYELQNFAHTPKPGFDCSNLILRAAQLAGIPFFFKNSLTIATHVKELPTHQKLAIGDIFWKKGHVIVVADTEKNTVIEARGYNNGSGRIQEIELSSVFKNVTTFDELVNAWHTGRALERLGDDGAVTEIIQNFKLLSLAEHT